MKDWLARYKLAVGLLTAAAAIALWFGFQYESPGERLDAIEVRVDSHIQTSDPTLKAVEDLPEMVQQQKAESDVTLELVSDIVRGECLESCYQKLALQGLIAKCKALGVERAMADEIDGKLDCE